MESVHDIVSSQFGEENTQSLASAWKRLDDEEISRLSAELVSAPDSLRGRFVSADRKILQVNASSSSGESTLVSEERISALQSQIQKLPFAEDVSVTGLKVLLTLEFPQLIEELRSGLILSIFLAVVVVAIATRNPLLALAALVPNLMPILFTESVMWVSGASLSVINVIGLTIAFGIAIDNAVHVINAYDKRAALNETLETRVANAVRDISSALLASTGIICVAAVITQFSSMPSVSELGQLLIATLIVALISNLAILPSAMICMLRLASPKRLQTT